ncbi:mitochondrial-associated sphingomyelin phosphodiesterase-domain-containing protein [Cladochytrium replicatum]|nr:mitochondrial-associated sphingomyelin phosphodiesterase-domain-containing protein [Cladochytrium replicatum]
MNSLGDHDRSIENLIIRNLSARDFAAGLNSILTRALDANDFPTSFYKLLPQICTQLFGNKRQAGYLQRFLGKPDGDVMLRFLQPEGSLVRSILRLHTEPKLQYEVHIESLPVPTQRIFKNADWAALPSIYQRRVQHHETIQPGQFVDQHHTQNHGQGVAGANGNKPVVQFNMFEYYLFSYAYAITLQHPASNSPPRVDNAAAGSKSPLPQSFKFAPSFLGSDTSRQRRDDPQLPATFVDPVYLQILQYYLDFFVPRDPSVMINGGNGSGRNANDPNVVDGLRQRGVAGRSRGLGDMLDSEGVPNSANASAASPRSLLNLNTLLNRSPIMTTRKTSEPNMPFEPPRQSHRENVYTIGDMDFGVSRGVQSALDMSEFVTGTLIELWLCQNDYLELTTSSNPRVRMNPHGGSGDGESEGGMSDVPRSSWADPKFSLDSATQAFIPPSPQQLRCIQILVRHVVSLDLKQAKPYVRDADYRRSGLASPDVYSVTRKNMYRALHQKLYWFLNLCFQTVPFSDGFEQIVDIWLTYITPWKVSGDARRGRLLDDDVVTEEWIPFILDNFLMYTYLFRVFLSRAVQLDLVSATRPPNQTTSSSGGPAPSGSGKEKTHLNILEKVLQTFTKSRNLLSILREVENALLSLDVTGLSAAGGMLPMGLRTPTASPSPMFAMAAAASGIGGNSMLASGRGGSGYSQMLVNSGPLVRHLLMTLEKRTEYVPVFQVSGMSSNRKDDVISLVSLDYLNIGGEVFNYSARQASVLYGNIRGTYNRLAAVMSDQAHGGRRSSVSEAPASLASFFGEQAMSATQYIMPSLAQYIAGSAGRRGSPAPELRGGQRFVIEQGMLRLQDCEEKMRELYPEAWMPNQSGAMMAEEGLYGAHVPPEMVKVDEIAPGILSPEVDLRDGNLTQIGREQIKRGLRKSSRNILRKPDEVVVMPYEYEFLVHLTLSLAMIASQKWKKVRQKAPWLPDSDFKWFRLAAAQPNIVFFILFIFGLYALWKVLFFVGRVFGGSWGGNGGVARRASGGGFERRGEWPPGSGVHYGEKKGDWM